MSKSKNQIVKEDDKNSFNAEAGNSILINDSIESESINQNVNFLLPKNNDIIAIDEDGSSQKDILQIQTSKINKQAQNQIQTSRSKNNEMTKLQNSLSIMIVQLEGLKQELKNSKENNPEAISNIHSKLSFLNKQIQSKESDILVLQMQKQSSNESEQSQNLLQKKSVFQQIKHQGDKNFDDQKLLKEKLLRQELMELHNNLQVDMKNQSSKRIQQNSYRSQMGQKNQSDNKKQDQIKSDFIMQASKIVINPKKKGEKQIELSTPMQIDSQINNLENIHLSSLLIEPSQISQANQNLLNQKIDRNSMPQFKDNTINISQFQIRENLNTSNQKHGPFLENKLMDLSANMLPSDITSNAIKQYKLSEIRSNEQNLRSENHDSFEYASNTIKGGLMNEDQLQANLQINGSRVPISAFSSQNIKFQKNFQKQGFQINGWNATQYVSKGKYDKLYNNNFKKKKGSQEENINTERNNETLQGSPVNNENKKAEANLKKLQNQFMGQQSIFNAHPFNVSQRQKHIKKLQNHAIREMTIRSSSNSPKNKQQDRVIELQIESKIQQQRQRFKQINLKKYNIQDKTINVLMPTEYVIPNIQTQTNKQQIKPNFIYDQIIQLSQNNSLHAQQQINILQQKLKTAQAPFRNIKAHHSMHGYRMTSQPGRRKILQDQQMYILNASQIQKEKLSNGDADILNQSEIVYKNDGFRTSRTHQYDIEEDLNKSKNQTLNQSIIQKDLQQNLDTIVQMPFNKTKKSINLQNANKKFNLNEFEIDQNNQKKETWINYQIQNQDRSQNSTKVGILTLEHSRYAEIEQKKQNDALAQFKKRRFQGVENVDLQNKSSASGGDTGVSVSYNLKTIFSHKFDLQYNNSKEAQLKQKEIHQVQQSIHRQKSVDKEKSSEICSPLLMERKSRPMMTIQDDNQIEETVSPQSVSYRYEANMLKRIPMFNQSKVIDNNNTQSKQVNNQDAKTQQKQNIQKLPQIQQNKFDKKETVRDQKQKNNLNKIQNNNQNPNDIQDISNQNYQKLRQNLEENSILTQITEKNIQIEKDEIPKNFRRSVFPQEDQYNRNKYNDTQCYDVSPGTEHVQSGVNSVLRNVTTKIEHHEHKNSQGQPTQTFDSRGGIANEISPRSFEKKENQIKFTSLRDSIETIADPISKQAEFSAFKRENKNLVVMGTLKTNILKNSLNYDVYEKNEEKQVKFQETSRSNNERKNGNKKGNEQLEWNNQKEQEFNAKMNKNNQYYKQIRSIEKDQDIVISHPYDLSHLVLAHKSFLTSSFLKRGKLLQYDYRNKQSQNQTISLYANKPNTPNIKQDSFKQSYHDNKEMQSQTKKMKAENNQMYKIEEEKIQSYSMLKSMVHSYLQNNLNNQENRNTLTLSKVRVSSSQEDGRHNKSQQNAPGEKRPQYLIQQKELQFCKQSTLHVQKRNTPSLFNDDDLNQRQQIPSQLFQKDQKKDTIQSQQTTIKTDLNKQSMIDSQGMHNKDINTHGNDDQSLYKDDKYSPISNIDQNGPSNLFRKGPRNNMEFSMSLQIVDQKKESPKYNLNQIIQEYQNNQENGLSTGYFSFKDQQVKDIQKNLNQEQLDNFKQHKNSVDSAFKNSVQSNRSRQVAYSSLANQTQLQSPKNRILKVDQNNIMHKQKFGIEFNSGSPDTKQLSSNSPLNQSSYNERNQQSIFLATDHNSSAFHPNQNIQVSFDSSHKRQSPYIDVQKAVKIQEGKIYFKIQTQNEIQANKQKNILLKNNQGEQEMARINFLQNEPSKQKNDLEIRNSIVFGQQMQIQSKTQKGESKILPQNEIQIETEQTNEKTIEKLNQKYQYTQIRRNHVCGYAGGVIGSKINDGIPQSPNFQMISQIAKSNLHDRPKSKDVYNNRKILIQNFDQSGSQSHEKNKFVTYYSNFGQQKQLSVKDNMKYSQKNQTIKSSNMGEDTSKTEHIQSQYRENNEAKLLSAASNENKQIVNPVSRHLKAAIQHFQKQEEILEQKFEYSPLSGYSQTKMLEPDISPQNNNQYDQNFKVLNPREIQLQNYKKNDFKITINDPLKQNSIQLPKNKIYKNTQKAQKQENIEKIEKQQNKMKFEMNPDHPLNPFTIEMLHQKTLYKMQKDLWKTYEKNWQHFTNSDHMQVQAPIPPSSRILPLHIYLSLGKMSLRQLKTSYNANFQVPMADLGKTTSQTAELLASDNTFLNLSASAESKELNQTSVKFQKDIVNLPLDITLYEECFKEAKRRLLMCSSRIIEQNVLVQMKVELESGYEALRNAAKSLINHQQIQKGIPDQYSLNLTINQEKNKQKIEFIFQDEQQKSLQQSQNNNMFSGNFGVNYDQHRDNDDVHLETYTLLNNEPTSRADNNHSLFSGEQIQNDFAGGNQEDLIAVADTDD